MSVRELLIVATAVYFAGFTLFLTVGLAILALNDRRNGEDGESSDRTTENAPH